MDGKLRLLALVICLLPFGELLGQQDDVIRLAPEIGHIMYDWNGAPTLFKERPAPVRMLFLTQKKDIDEKTWAKIFSCFNVGILQDGKEADMSHFVVERKTFIDESIDKTKFANHVIDISSGKDGWQEGYYIIGLGLDTGGLERAGLPKVRYLGQDTEIRLTCRTMKNEDDKLLRLRYEVFRHARDEKSLPWEPDKALQAIAELHKEFPGDCYGHAFAGYILESQKKYAESIEHYKKVRDAILNAYPKDPMFWNNLPDPEYVAPTKEFEKLKFNRWMGIDGARKLLNHMENRIFCVGGELKKAEQNKEGDKGKGEKR